VSAAFIHLFNNMAEQFVDYRDPNKVAFGDKSPSKLTKILIRHGKDIIKGIKGGYIGLNKILNMDTTNDPMAEILILKLNASGTRYGFSRSGSKIVPLVNPVNLNNAYKKLSND